MSVGPLNVAGSVAGSLPQMRGAEADRAQQATVDQSRQTQSAQQAENAAGVGETAEEEQASDRDADGRRLWERRGSHAKADAAEAPEAEETPRVKDPTGISGGTLDLIA